jgi:hypothetical protein
MPKILSVAQLGRGGLLRAIRAAQHEPILITELNHPKAWIVSAEALAGVATGTSHDDVYRRTLELLVVVSRLDDYRREAERVDGG